LKVFLSFFQGLCFKTKQNIKTRLIPKSFLKIELQDAFFFSPSPQELEKGVLEIYSGGFLVLFSVATKGVVLLLPFRCLK
jgi:hypothetical protein